MEDNYIDIQLRPTTLSDLESLYLFQLDKEAIQLAAFTPKEPISQTEFITKHSRFLNDPNINNQTILINNIIVGSIAKFVMEGDAEITYWLDKNFWGKGITTKALEKFLDIETTRPLHARVAFDNLGSQKVLEKCGFIRIGIDKGFANAREKEIEEFIYKLS